MFDFTLQAYAKLLAAVRDAGYRTCAVIDWLDGPRTEEPLVVLRHDVDRNPRNALAMARLEAAQGVRATYYFRIVPVSFVPEIIKEIAALGHEVGYHYEDWHRGAYRIETALPLFAEALAKIRAIAPVRSISMHGSPFSKENNLTIWQHAEFRDYAVKDCLLSDRWSGFAYFTDAGRTFGATSANLRDVLADADAIEAVRSTRDLAVFVSLRERQRMMISTHPERWSDDVGVWTTQWLRDLAANTVKRGLRLLRAPSKSGYAPAPGDAPR